MLSPRQRPESGPSVQIRQDTVAGRSPDHCCGMVSRPSRRFDRRSHRWCRIRETCGRPSGRVGRRAHNLIRHNLSSGVITIVTPAQIQFFEEHGYVTGVPIHGEVEVARIRQAFDELEEREGKENCAIGLQGRHVDVRFIWELASHSAIVDCIEALMGHDVMVLSTHFFCKYPGTTEQFVAWHQDVTYWGLEPPYALTAWYAVDDSDVENGCMRVIPGSHRQGIVEHGKSARAGNQLSINQEVSVEIDESSAVDLELKAGQISLHHGHLIHSSNPNCSGRRRCGLTLRYCPPTVKPAKVNSVGKPWPAILVRGEDRFNHFGNWELTFA